MEAHISEAELIGDRRGKIAAGIGFILLVILLLIPVFYKLNPPPGQPGIAVLLSFDEVGSGNDPGAAPQTRPVEDPTPTPPPPPTPPVVEPEPEPTPPPPTPSKPVEEKRDVIKTESPQEIALRKQKAEEKARREAADRKRKAEADAAQRAEQARQEAIRKQRAEQAAREAAIAEAEAKAEAERKARAARAAEFGSSIGGSFGGGGGAGNDGQPGSAGNPDGVRTGAPTAGSGRGNVKGFGNRGVLASPPVRDNSQQAGTVVMRVCIGQDGRVTSVKFTQSGSRNATPQLKQQAEANAKRWRFSADPTAPAEQCGSITYNFKVQ